MGKLWGGRFEEEPSELMRQFGDSLRFDIRLWDVDIRGSSAYAQALAKARILGESELSAILDGLAQVRREFERGEFVSQAADEDIHTAVERRLRELVGPVAGKLHTGRSRNDQVATDMRLYMREQTERLETALSDLQRRILIQAKKHLDVIMPGYTHLQPAQPVRFSHWLMSFFWMFQRDRERLQEIWHRVNVLPLGAGALSGNPLGIDQKYLADVLGFGAVAYNSIDAVSDRDYLVEFLGWASLAQIHLSRLAESLILFSSREFGFVGVADAYATGSSLMPQKKNADSLELVRGKTGRVVGNLMGLLTVLKGLPSAYDKDLQEDKEGIFDAIDTLSQTLPVAGGVIASLTVDARKMRQALSDEMLATELADYLVKRGIPFRDAHHLVGQVVRVAVSNGYSLRTMPLSDYQNVCPAFATDCRQQLDFERAIERRDSIGGTARVAVEAQIAAAEKMLGG
jgi:argininosuccinate lyase